MHPDMDERLDALEARMGVAFQNRALLIEALTHRSYRNENYAHPTRNNELLEFLGDAVLEIVVTEHLFDCYAADHTEGELTTFRGALVRATTLARVGEALSLIDVLLLSRGQRTYCHPGAKARRYILSNTVEAILGALYRDQGMGECRLFVDAHILAYLTEIITASPEYKAQLQELAQGRFGITPTYRVLSQSGPDHARRFCMAVVLGDHVVAEAESDSKKDAQTDAARVALETIHEWEGRLVGRASSDVRLAKRRARRMENRT
jgi:ribonuclease III